MGHPKLHEVFGRIEDCRASQDLPIVVFDLDSTLFSTAERNLAILHEFAGEHAGNHPRLPEITSSLSADDMGWNIHQSLMERGVEDERLIEDLKAFWLERFFTDEYCFLDAVTPGAPEYVSRVHEAGALVYYLTGRHVGGMELGTIRSLLKHGFPCWRGRTEIHLKPDFETPDKDFKDDAIRDIHSLSGRVVATFENEPGNANLFVEAFPEALHFLLETVTSPEPEVPHESLILGPDFHLP